MANWQLRPCPFLFGLQKLGNAGEALGEAGGGLINHEIPAPDWEEEPKMNFDNVLGPANVNLIRGGSGAAQQEMQ